MEYGLLHSALLAVSLALSACSGGGGAGDEAAPTEEETTQPGGVKSSGNLPNAGGAGGKASTVKALGTLAKTTGTGTGTATKNQTSTATTATALASDPVKSQVIYLGAESLKAGVPVSIQFKGVDTQGVPRVEGGEKIAFTIVSGTGSGSFGPVEDHGDGSYTGTFVPEKVGSALILGATIGKALAESTSEPLTIVPGDIDLSHSVPTVDSVELGGGTSTLVRWTPRDSWDNLVTEAGLVPVFSLVDGTSTGVFSAVQSASDGTFQTELLGLKAGTPSAIKVQVGVQATALEASPRVKVVPGSLSPSDSVITLASTGTGNPGEIPSGSTVQMTLLAKDAGGNQLTKGGAVIVWSTSSGAGLSTGLLSDMVDHDNGTYTANLRAQAVGSPMTIRATANGVSLTSVLPTLRVIPGSMSTSMSTLDVVDGTSSLAAGSQTTVRVRVKDSNGNIITAPDQNFIVAFGLSSGTSTGSFQAATKVSPGIYQSLLTAELAGSLSTLTATIDGQTITSPAPTLQVIPGPTSLAQSSLSLGSATLNSGSNTLVTLTLKDAYGNIISNLSPAVTFEAFGSGTSSVIIGSTTSLGAGAFQATVTGVLAGTPRTLRARIAGQATTSTAPALTVVPGPLSLSQSTLTVDGGATFLSSGSSLGITLTTRDAAGNQLAVGGAPIALVLEGSGTSTGAFGTVTDAGNGLYTTTFTGQGAGTAISLRGSVNGQPLTSGAPSLTVQPGPASLTQSVVTLSGSTTSVASGSSVTATLQTKDNFGNLLPSGGLAVTFVTSGGTSSVQLGSITDNSNGTYSMPITGILKGSALSVIGQIGGTPLTSTAPQLTVTQGPLSLATSTTNLSSSSIISGQTTTATLTTRDAAGNVFSTGGLTVSFGLSGGTSGGSFAAVTDHGDGTYSSVMTGTTSGTVSNVQTTVSSSLMTSTAPTVIVQPAGPDLSQSSSSLSLTTVSAGSVSTLTVILRDAYGNLIPTGGHTVAATLSSDGTSTALVGSAVDLANGTYTFSLTGQTAGTASSVTVTVGGSALTSTAPTLTVTPGPLSRSTSTVSVGNASVASGTATTATLTLKDTYNNSINDGLQSVTFEGFGAGTSTMTFGAVTYAGAGVYQASVTGVLAGSARTIRAQVGGQPTISTAPTITVTPGAISLAQSTVAINGGATAVTSGASVTLTLTGRDGAGNLLTSGGQAVTFTKTGVGTSTGSFGTVTDGGNGTYTVVFTGLLSGTAVSLQGSVSGQPLTSAAPTITVLPGPYSLAQSLVTITGGLTSVASGSSVTAVLTAKDASGNELPTGGLTVTFIKSGGVSTVSFGAVTDHGNGTYSVDVTGILKGSAAEILGRINGSSLTSAAPQLTVTQGPLSLATSTTTRSVGSVAAGQSSDITFTARDAAGNVFSTGGLTVDFSINGTSQGTFATTTDGGNGTYTAVFTGTIAGAVSTIDTTVGGSQVTSTSPTIAVTPGPFDPGLSTMTLSTAIIQAGSGSVLTVTLIDSYGNQLTSGGHTVASSLDVDGTSTVTFGAPTYLGNGVYEIALTGQLSGTPTTFDLTIDGVPLTSSSPSITVQTGGISTVTSVLTIESSSIISGTNYWVRLTAKDAAGNLVTTGGSTIVFSHSGGTSTGTFGAVTDVGDGTYTATLTGVTAGTETTLGATIGGVAVTSTAPTFTVTSAASTVFVLNGIPGTVTAGDLQTLTVTAKDLNHNVDTNYVGTVNITTTDAQGVITPATYTFSPEDLGIKNFSVTLKTAGTQDVTATDAGNPLVTTTQSGITVIAAPASNIAFAGVSEAKVMMCSPNLSVQSQDNYGNPSPVDSTLTVALTGQGNATLYSDATCTNPVTELPLYSASSGFDLYLKSSVPENLSLLASASGLISISKNVAVKPYQAWLGSYSTTSLYAPGGHALRGRFDGMLNGALATVTDGDGKIYVADSSNHRVQKFDPVNGFEGWIGRVSVLPTGGFAGCNAAVNLTPGWCLGGFASSGSGDGQMNNPGGLAVSSTYLYVADSSNHRVLRYELDTGTFMGWTGRILTSPTGGDIGCAGAAVGTTTPGWCLGGTAQSGTGMGQYNTPRNLMVYDNYLYISDNANHRIAKFNLDTAVMESWIGWINTSPTGGVAGCSGAAVSTVTPGWCSGGTSKTGTVMGSLKNQRGMATDGNYLFVADTGNHRIQRYILATGAVDSWIGRVSTKPTGGAAGCTTVAVNSFTPGWCTGGIAKSGNTTGSMSSPYSVAIIGSDMLVADYTNHRINKYVTSTAAVIGWTGRVLTTPTSGAAGCSTTAIGNATPGWCIGGTAQSGIEDGMFNGPANVYADGGSLLVADSLNYRIAKLDPTTASYTGWLGGRSTLQSDWSTVWKQPNLSGRDNNSFYGALGVTSDGTNLYVADGTNHRLKSYTITSTSLSFAGWLGAVWSKPTAGGPTCTGVALNATTPTWCDGGSAKTGTSNGQFNTPNDLYADGTHLYAVDKTNHRIQKFNKSTAAFVGWIGRISTSPTGGDPGCSGAAVNSFTPGWCSGGTAKSGTADGHFNSPQGIFGDSTYIYVVDTANNRVARFSKGTGAFGGWIGRVLTVPTGGASGCTTVPVGSPTPGWCTGGTAQTGTGDGAMSAPTDATGDGTYLYVSDSTNNRLLRFDIATGSFTGWLGRISVSPTGGDAGCAGALSGTATPGYCTGGTAQNGTGNGHLRTPRGLWSNSTFLYVVDGANHRIVKLTLGGTFVGWQGRIGSVPTAGESGCLGGAVGTLTQGWCQGGTALRGDGVGMFDTPMFITGADSTYLVVTQSNNAVLTRVPY